MIEHKSISEGVKAIEDRTVIGIATVFGVVDDGHDRSHPGSFADTKINGRNRTRFLWQHDSSTPPTAIINYVREVSRDQLPEKVISLASEATGGVEISRTYLNSQRANEVLEGIKAGVIQEMSYAYEVTSHSITEEQDKPPIRELLGLKIFDFSDVQWGMVPYSLADSSKNLEGWTGNSLPLDQHSETVVSVVQEYFKRVRDRQDFRQKEGRVLSGATRSRITQLLESLKAVSLDLDTLLRETEPKADPAITRALFIEFQRLQAQLNGAMNYAN